MTGNAEEPIAGTQAGEQGAGTSYFRYVPYERVPAYDAIGWRALDGLAGTAHGEFSVLCEWRGEGEPVEPRE